MRPQHLSKRQALYFPAGEGNASLIKAAGLRTRLGPPPPAYGVLKTKRPAPTLCALHRRQFHLTPRLTVTSHQDVNGNTVWYLGGEIAESGVGKSETEQSRRHNAQSAGVSLAGLIPRQNGDASRLTDPKRTLTTITVPMTPIFARKEYTGCLAYQADPDACAGRANFTKSDSG